MGEATGDERASALRKVKRLFEEFDFTVGMLEGSSVEGQVRNEIEKFYRNRTASGYCK